MSLCAGCTCFVAIAVGRVGGDVVRAVVVAVGAGAVGSSASVGTASAATVESALTSSADASTNTPLLTRRLPTIRNRFKWLLPSCANQVSVMLVENLPANQVSASRCVAAELSMGSSSRGTGNQGAAEQFVYEIQHTILDVIIYSLVRESVGKLYNLLAMWEVAISSSRAPTVRLASDYPEYRLRCTNLYLWNTWRPQPHACAPSAGV